MILTLTRNVMIYFQQLRMVVGGCPYAPGAAGNVSTEDVVALLEASGVSTGVDLDALVDASAWLEDEILGRPLPSRVFRATRGARARKGEQGR